MPFANVNRHDLYYEDSGGKRPRRALQPRLPARPLDVGRAGGGVRARVPLHHLGRARPRHERVPRAVRLLRLGQRRVSLLDQLGIPKATMVGMSQGGFLSDARGVEVPGAREGAGADRHGRGAVLGRGARRLPRDRRLLARARAGRRDRERHGRAPVRPEVQGATSGWAKWQSKPPSETAHPWETVLARDDFMAQAERDQVPVARDPRQPRTRRSISRRPRACATTCPTARAWSSCSGAAHAPNVTHPKPLNDGAARVPGEEQHDTARLRHLRRRQPLLRAARRVHPLDRAALPRPRRARGRHGRGPASRSWIGEREFHFLDDTFASFEKHAAARLAARVPEVARQRAAGRARVGRDPDGPGLREPRRAARAHGRAGRRGGVPVPDARRLRRALPEGRRRARPTRTCARSTAGSTRPGASRGSGRIFASPVISLLDPDEALRDLEWALAHDARSSTCAPGRPAATRPPIRSSTASGRSRTRRSSRSRTTSARPATTR